MLGTQVLLDHARHHGKRFVQVSTDEVYGDIPLDAPACTEDAPLRASSPYSASKAGGELQVFAYVRTYGVDALVTRGANTYGPRQYPEKFLPLFVTNALDRQPLPVYGDGKQRREWLQVDDHCAGIELALRKGEAGNAYNIGGQERENLDVVRRILDLTGASPDLVRHVEDRPGHDRRYAVDSSKLRDLGWSPEHSFDAGGSRTWSGGIARTASGGSRSSPATTGGTTRRSTRLGSTDADQPSASAGSGPCAGAMCVRRSAAPIAAAADREQRADHERDVVAAGQRRRGRVVADSRCDGARRRDAREHGEAERAAHHERGVDDARREARLLRLHLTHRGEQHRVERDAGAERRAGSSRAARRRRSCRRPVRGRTGAGPRPAARSPAASGLRTPKRITSFAERRSRGTPITRFPGRKPSPTLSGE